MAKANNPRYQCHHCSHRVTRNQLKGSNGICIYCKTPMNHTNWMGGAASTIAQQLRISTTTEEELNDIALNVGVPVIDIVRAATLKALEEWRTAPDSRVAIRNDLLLTKLKS